MKEPGDKTTQKPHFPSQNARPGTHISLRQTTHHPKRPPVDRLEPSLRPCRSTEAIHRSGRSGRAAEHSVTEEVDPPFYMTQNGKPSLSISARSCSPDMSRKSPHQPIPFRLRSISSPRRPRSPPRRAAGRGPSRGGRVARRAPLPAVGRAPRTDPVEE